MQNLENLKVIFKISHYTEKECNNQKHASAVWLEWVYSIHGHPANAIRRCEHDNKPATLENVLAECEQYDRQEHEDDPMRFMDGRYMYEHVFVDLVELIKAGWVYIEIYDE